MASGSNVNVEVKLELSPHALARQLTLVALDKLGRMAGEQLTPVARLEAETTLRRCRDLTERLYGGGAYDELG